MASGVLGKLWVPQSLIFAYSRISKGSLGLITLPSEVRGSVPIYFQENLAEMTEVVRGVSTDGSLDSFWSGFGKVGTSFGELDPESRPTSWKLCLFMVLESWRRWSSI